MTPQVPLLDRFVTGDEQWIPYDNIKHLYQWICQGNRPAQQLHPKKWDIQGIVHYQLFDNNQTITSKLCSNQLHLLKIVLNKKYSIHPPLW